MVIIQRILGTQSLMDYFLRQGEREREEKYRAIAESVSPMPFSQYIQMLSFRYIQMVS